jgi:hypothetical protein
MSTLQAMDWDSLQVHTAGGGKGFSLHVHCAGGGKIHSARSYCWRWKGIHGHTPHSARLYCWRWKEIHHTVTSILPAVENDTPCTSIEGWGCCYSWYLMLKTQKQMPEKVRTASAFLPILNCLSPASGSVRYRWSRIRPALPSNGISGHFQSKYIRTQPPLQRGNQVWRTGVGTLL